MSDESARKMTVALVREAPEADFVEVAFFQSARFFRLPKSSTDFEASFRRLRTSQAEGRPVEVTLAASGSEEIVRVRGPGGE